MEALVADVLKSSNYGPVNEDEYEEDEDENPSKLAVKKPKFLLDCQDPPTPALIHDGEDYDLWVGPLWSVKISKLDPSDVTQHLAALTCEPNKGKKKFSPWAKSQVFHIGCLSKGRLYMPPWYAKLAFPKAHRVRNATTRGNPMRPGVAFSGSLYSHPPQQQAAKHYISWLAKNIECSSCIISLPCGYGKTVLFLYIAAALGRVTLVLAHKLPLVDQWITEARRFLPAGRVGYIKADGIRIEGVDVIIASIQSLHSHIQARKPYLKRLREIVGTLCMDEGHHGVASTFSEVYNYVPAIYRFVLTATPRRKDGLMNHLQMIAGPIIFRAFRQVGEVHVLCLKYLSEAHVELRRGKMLQHQEMTNRLTQDDNRTEIGCRLMSMLVDQGRRFLIVTPRVEHVHAVGDRLDALFGARANLRHKVTMFVEDPKPNKRRKRKEETREEADRLANEALWEWQDTGPHGHDEVFEAPVVGRVLQGMKQLDRELQYEATFTVTTTQMMEEGVSYKKWDTLIDFDNVSDPEQVIGRILRACPTKRVPLVVDMWIAVSLFSGLFYKRFNFYKAEGFTRTWIEVEKPKDLESIIDVVRYDVPAPAVL